MAHTIRQAIAFRRPRNRRKPTPRSSSRMRALFLAFHDDYAHTAPCFEHTFTGRACLALLWVAAMIAIAGRAYE